MERRMAAEAPMGEDSRKKKLLAWLGLTQKLPVTATIVLPLSADQPWGQEKETQSPAPRPHWPNRTPGPAVTSRSAVIARLRSSSAARRFPTARVRPRPGSGGDGEPRSRGGVERSGFVIGRGGLTDGLTGCIRTPQPAAPTERGRWSLTCRSGRSPPSPSASKSSPWATPKWGK